MKNADSLIAIAKVHGVNPSGINLEITETTDCGEEGVLFVHKLLAEGFTNNSAGKPTVLTVG